MTDVYLEIGRKRVFACALDWPGWCRAGRGEAEALAQLVAYGARYEAVAADAGLAFDPGGLEVVERLSGSTTTDFGAPDRIPAADRAPVSAEDGSRLAALVEAAWHVFDRIVAGSPAELRKGPRGGGRDRDKMVEHVLAAEAAYARKIGIRQRQPARDNPAAVAALRAGILEALRAPSDGQPATSNGWPVRYAARRIAWHVLDHAWEMQDRATAIS